MADRLQRACGGGRWVLVLAIVLIVGLGLRLDFAIRTPNEPVYDARAYARIAAAISAGEGFTQGPGTKRLRLQDASNYTPGLPLLIAGIYEARGNADERAARILLAILSSLAIPLSFLLGKRLGGPIAGSIAAVSVAIYPALLEYSGMLMTEPLGTTLLAGAILAFLWAWDGSRWWPWALSGLLLGGMTILRPEYLLLIGALPAIGLLRLHREGRLKKDGLVQELMPIALMVGCACLIVLPWTVRNFIVLDRLVPLSTGGGQVLYQGSYLPAGPDPERMGPVFLEEHPQIRRKLEPWPGPIYRGQAVAELAARLHPGEDTDRALTKMAVESYADAATEEPLALAGFFAGKVWHAWTAPARSVMRFPPWRVLQLALLLAAGIGLAVGLARRRFDVLVLAVTLLSITLVQAIYIASPRRTLVLMPEISALAGLGLVWCVSLARRDSLARWRR